MWETVAVWEVTGPKKARNLTLVPNARPPPTDLGLRLTQASGALRQLLCSPYEMAAGAYDPATGQPPRATRRRGRVRPTGRKRRLRHLRQLRRRTRIRSEVLRLQRHRFLADRALDQELEALQAELARRDAGGPWWRRLPGVARWSRAS